MSEIINVNIKVVITLCLVIAVLSGALVYDFFYTSFQEDQLKMNQTNQQKGYEYALLQIYDVVSQCKSTPITYQNTTINVVAMECLRE